MIGDAVESTGPNAGEMHVQPVGKGNGITLHFTSLSSLVILISSPTAKVRQELTQFLTNGSSDVRLPGLARSLLPGCGYGLGCAYLAEDRRVQGRRCGQRCDIFAVWRDKLALGFIYRRRGRNVGWKRMANYLGINLDR